MTYNPLVGISLFLEARKDAQSYWKDLLYCSPVINDGK
jgi:hypothetical protein